MQGRGTRFGKDDEGSSTLHDVCLSDDRSGAVLYLLMQCLFEVINFSFKKAEYFILQTAILFDYHNSTETTTVRGTMDREAKQRSSNHAISRSLARSLIQTVDASTHCVCTLPAPAHAC